MKLFTTIIVSLLFASCQKELTPVQEAPLKATDSTEINVEVTVLEWPWPNEPWSGQFGLQMKSSQRVPADLWIKVSFYVDFGNGNILPTYAIKGISKGNWWQTCAGGYSIKKVTRFKLEEFGKIPGYKVSVTLK